MNKRHLWLLLTTLLLLGGWIGFRWLFPSDSTTIPVASRDAAIDGETSDRLAVSVSMPADERQDLAARGVLTNADRPMHALTRDPAVIMLRNAIIDTEIVARGGPSVDIPEAFRAPPDYRQAMIVFEEPISGRHWDWLAEQGVRVENFVPNRALTVSGPHQNIRQLREARGVRHVEPFHPFYKMDADIQAYLTGSADSGARERARSGRYQILLFGDPETAMQAAMQPDDARRLPAIDTPGAAPLPSALGVPGARIQELPRLPRQAVAEVYSDPESLKQLVLAENVKWIEPVPQFQTMNDLARRTLRRHLVEEKRPDFDGSGQVVGVVDTGADINHPWLADRLRHYAVKSGPSSDGQQGDTVGHGTHVLGTILGSGTNSHTVTSAPGSFTLPGTGGYAKHQFRGMAPNAEYVMIEDFNSYTHPEMALLAHQQGARIGNNSWGSKDVFEYGIASMYWDALVKDVDWDNPNPQPYTVFFAAGNSGGGAFDGTGGTPGTISQPGNAKNVITIGALEQKRDADNLTQSPFRSHLATDSDWQVASFSGRGPTRDGRIKPDLVAPGAYVLSLQSSDVDSEIIDAPLSEMRDFKAGNVATGSEYAFMSGTSRSTAFASGAGALLRQFYQNQYGRNPSPAMMKAMLIGGARPVHGHAYEWGPKRDGSTLAIGNIVHEGDPRPHADVFNNLFGWWQFNGDYENDEDLNFIAAGTNLYLNPEDDPGQYIEGLQDFEAADANPGFGQYINFRGGSVRIEMTPEAIADGYHNDNDYRIRTIEFWIRRPGTVSGTQPILDFETLDNERIFLEAPNVVAVEGLDENLTTIYVNGSKQLPILTPDEWNHVVIVSDMRITATNFTLGNLTAGIDELRFYSSRLNAAEVQQNYEDGLGYIIMANPVLDDLLRDGMFRESAIYDGWGQLDVAGAIFGSQTFHDQPRVLFQQMWDEGDVTSLTTGADSWFINYDVLPADANGSLKVTLTWTDAFGEPSAARSLVNDLDLVVRYKPGTDDEIIYLGNFLGRKTWGMASYPIRIDEDHVYDPMSVIPGQTAAIQPIVLQDERQLEFLRDRHNNVEQVIIRDVLPGRYRIYVEPHQVPAEGQDGGQTFALVVTPERSSAGESMGRDPDLSVDRDNTPVLAYTTRTQVADPFGGIPERTQIAVRRWIDREAAIRPEWHRIENKWFHYGDGAHREIVSRSEIGGAHSPSLTFGADNTLYLAWIQQNDAAGVPDAVYLRYLEDADQESVWNDVTRWKQRGGSYQGLGISGSHFDDDAVSPTVRVAWNNQPVVAYRQQDRVLVKMWSTNNLAWQGLDATDEGVVATDAAATPVGMAIDTVGHPVLLWQDGGTGRLRVVRWDGSQWRNVAGGLLGDATARDAAVACDAFGTIVVSWIQSEEGIPSVRVARTTIGGTAWNGLGAGTVNSMLHPGVCRAANENISHTRIAMTPRGNLWVSWLASQNTDPSRLLVSKWDGTQWDEISGSDQLPGIYDATGALDQPALISDTNGFPIVALRSMRTGNQEIQILRSQVEDTGGLDPDPDPDPDPLTVTQVSSDDGNYQAGDVIVISVQFETNVVVSGTPALALNTQPVTRYAFYQSGSGSDTLIFHYVVQEDDTADPLEYTGADALILSGSALIVDGVYYFEVSLPAPGQPGSLSDTSTITVDGSTTSAFQLSIRGPNSSGFVLSWDGEPGNEYDVLYSILPSGIQWNVLTNLPYTNTVMIFYDHSAATTDTARLYRVLQKPDQQ